MSETQEIKDGLTASEETEAREDATYDHIVKYTGFLGVDMMIYRDGVGQYKIQPCVEINLRYNMGIVALQLQRHLAESAEGHFRVRFSAKPGDISSSVEEQRQMFPLERHDGAIVSGYIHLTPVDENSRFVAELQVEKK